MPSQIKKACIRTIFVFLLSVFVTPSLSQDFEEEDIACQDLPQALNRYNNDIQLERYSVKSTLRSLSSFLESVSQQEALDQRELLNLIKKIENMYSLVQENEMLLSDRADNIEYFLEECLTPSQ